MDNNKSLLEICAELTMEELEGLSFTKIVKGQKEDSKFIGLGIMDENGYLLDYYQLKKIYAGIDYFIRNVNPELIQRMNAQKLREDQVQREKDELIDLVSRNIVDKEELEDELQGDGLLDSIKSWFKKNE